MTLRSRNTVTALLIKPEDFASLEKDGRRQLSQELRSQLQSKLEALCGSQGDELLELQRKSASERRRYPTLHSQVEDFARQAEKLRKSFDEHKWLIYPGNALAFPYPTKHIRVSETLSVLVGDARSSAHILRSKAPSWRRSPGPKTDIWLERFFFAAADIYAAAGGRISSAWQADKRTRNSPFIRFLLRLRDVLPDRRRELVPSGDRLGEWVHRIGEREWRRFREQG